MENTDYAAFARRVIAAHARRVASGDVEALAELVSLCDWLDRQIRTAIAGLRGHGHRWAELADRLQVSRQAAQQRWNTPAQRSTASPEVVRSA